MNLMSTLPTYEAESFSRWLVKATEAYFEKPDVKKRFNAWKKERDRDAHREIDKSTTV